MNTNKQGTPITYENSFKIAMAREYLTGNLGYGHWQRSMVYQMLEQLGGSLNGIREIMLKM